MKLKATIREEGMVNAKSIIVEFMAILKSSTLR